MMTKKQHHPHYLLQLVSISWFLSIIQSNHPLKSFSTDAFDQCLSVSSFCRRFGHGRFSSISSTTVLNNSHGQRRQLFLSNSDDNNNSNIISDNENNNTNEVGIRLKEAELLLAKAKQIRESIGEQSPSSSLKERQASSNNNNNNDTRNAINQKIIFSQFNVNTKSENIVSSSCEFTGYRLYVDIGREDGTWMDPRWGASGKRIEFTIDIAFLLNNVDDDDYSNVTDLSLASQDIIDNMVKDNLSGTSSAVRIVQSAPKARLRKGFDQMNVSSGGYRVDRGGGDKGSKGKQQRLSTSNTVRFYLNVDGTEESSSNYGDIFIPKGNLYFSLPCFGSNVKQLSTKEGIVTVRQIGWHTGWRREESRIVGVFRAVPIDQAMKRDGF